MSPVAVDPEVSKLLYFSKQGPTTKATSEFHAMGIGQINESNDLDLFSTQKCEATFYQHSGIMK